MKRVELLKNSGYWISKIQIGLYNQMKKYMVDNDINQSQLARKLGVSKGYVSQVLKGDFNYRISTLVDLSLAMNKVPELRFTDLNQLIEEESQGIKSITWTVKINQSEINSASLDGQSEYVESTTNINPQGTIANQVSNLS